MSSSCQLVLLPGLGADERLFEPQRRVFGNLMVPAWIPPQGRETLAEYAARFARTIPCSRPMVLGGVSLGGMMAYEMARHLRPDVVVLMASCRNYRSVRSVFVRLRPIARRLPLWAVERSKWFARLGMAGIIGASGQHKRLCAAMYRDADSRFMRWALDAILHWDPAPLEGVRILQIHGDRDRLIPASKVQADEVIRGGGHFINMVDADRVNQLLGRAMAMAQRHGLGD